MVTRTLACPSCEVKLRVPGSIPSGKRIRCPKCKEPFPVPEEEEETPAPSKVAPARSRKPAPPPEDDEDEREDEPVARKRRKKPQKAASNAPLFIALGVGGVLLLGGGAALAVVFWPSKKTDTPAAQNQPASLPAPAGQQTGPGPATGGVVSAAGETQPSAAGRKVFEANNCSRCHSLGDDSGGGKKGRARGPNLSRTGASHTAEWLMGYVRDPKAQNPESRMPAYGAKIKEEDLRALGEYLASLK